MEEIYRIANNVRTAQREMKGVGIISITENHILLDKPIDGMTVLHEPYKSNGSSNEYYIRAKCDGKYGFILEAVVFDSEPEYAGLLADWESHNGNTRP